ncbi:MAG: L-serine ammonia-lyase, iron-sulfur-dependent, subunit alpha [Treponema sp.]|jgi:L-serine dehydratase|nr:L-serine ammonia-lyase, iron-sulfur-dependent, subunit alpha [Treponema sp.]
MAFDSLASLTACCEKKEKPFWRVVCENEQRESGLSQAQELKKMQTLWAAMLSAADAYDANLFSASGLTGSDGGKFETYLKGGTSICGSFTGAVIAQALQMGESNACMKRIVASPTAGSCGVLPAVLVPLYREKKFTESRIIESLFTAAGIGQVIANRASISGAEGGCQAEIGSAAAMAAGALVSLFGGTPQQIINAAGFALQNLLGLVCDPVAGLVEIPCVKRNVIGALDACSCADMALAGIVPKIPPDEVIDALRQTGDKMDVSLKETGQGGIAATPTGRQIAQTLSEKNG